MFAFVCRNLADFNRLLGLSMEMLLRSCENVDTDIRLVGDECLNRLIKVCKGTVCAVFTLVMGASSVFLCIVLW